MRVLNINRTPADFGPAYFKKFYGNAATRVVTPAEMQVRARMIAAVLAQASVPVHSILDAGCGVGLLRKAFADVLPRACYTGLESSEYLCTRYGWIRGSVTDYAVSKPRDLVICYDVLQYLGDRAAARAITNLSRMTSAALYISALTCEDWRTNCDRARTDRAVHLRQGDWYRRRLQRRFHYLALGIWLRKNVTPMLWDLEQT